MTIFTVGAEEIEQKRPSGFREFLEIAKGRSIISAGDWEGQGRFEVGLSGGMMLRFFFLPPMEVNMISTVNADEIPPVLIALGDLPRQVPLWMIEHKLRGLRTLYAIFFLAENNRLGELTDFIAKQPEGDIERSLLKESDRLYVESISYGSWVLAIWAKTKNAFKSVSSVAGLVFERGREAYLSRLEAESRLLGNKANLTGIEAAQAQFDLNKNQLNYLLEVSDRIDAPEIKEMVKQRILDSVDALVLGDPNEVDARKRLSGPS